MGSSPQGEWWPQEKRQHADQIPGACEEVSPPCLAGGPRGRLWDHWQKKGHGMCRRQQERLRATRAHHLTRRRSCEGRKGSVSSALHSSQDRLEGQSHEVSRCNRESRGAKAGTLGQSCFSRGQAIVLLPPAPRPTPVRMAPLSSQLRGHRGAPPRLCSSVGLGPKTSCCPGTAGSTEPIVHGGAGLEARG